MSDSTRSGIPRGQQATDVDVLVVGAGFGGMYALHKLRGLGYSVRVLEAGSGVGGTWFWNRYPGARCDVESMDYSYSFDAELQQEWKWTERFASQPEILRYANHVADRFDLRRDIDFNTRVRSAVLDEASALWEVTTDAGRHHKARFVLMAVGNLSATQVPAFEGIDTFEGELYHTGAWPHEGVDLTGKRVAVVGTGSSGIQSIPVIAAQAAHTTVFQRTPHFSLPARNTPLDPDFQQDFKKQYAEHRAKARMAPAGTLKFGSGKKASEHTVQEREEFFERLWREGGPGLIRSYTDVLTDAEANEKVAEFVRGKIGEIVREPWLAKKLTPTSYPIGTKRPVLDTNYYEVFNFDNVELVDVLEAPITALTRTGIDTTEASYDFDVIVFATGFDAVTGALLRIDIRGRENTALRDAWAAGPRAYLGIATHGFPNLFFLTGPGSPSVLTNMITAIEQHVEWVADALEYLRGHGHREIEAQLEHQDAWVEHVNELADQTLMPRANSWFLGANVPGKPRVFMVYVGGLGTYRTRCEEIADNNYEGFNLQ